MYCMKCGQQLLDEARFCPNCGKGVVATPPPPSPAAPAPVPPPPSQDTSAAPAPVVAAPPVAPPPPPEPPIAEHAHVGRNVLSLSWAYGVEQIAEDVAAAPEVAETLQSDPMTAATLSGKLKVAIERVEPHHDTAGAVGQTFDKLKRASEALIKGRQVQAAISAVNPDNVFTDVELTEPEVALYDQCAQQVLIRNGLELRLLRTCTSCRLQRIVNPEYERMQRTDSTVGSILSLSSNALLALYRWRRGMPRFVCARCQGMSSVDHTVVLCPDCGTIATDTLLSRCAKCGHDFAHPEAPHAAPAMPGGPLPQPPPPPPPAAPAPPRKILSGKCATCGNEFRVPVDMIPAGGLKAKCKGCGAPLTIRRPAEKKPVEE